jgi:Uma2 family endonuclease
MTDPARRTATYEDLLALPDHVIGQIVDGELHAQPRPAARHALASSAIGGALFGSFNRQGGGGGESPGGWWILFEPEVHLGRDVVVPDLAGWRRERMPDLPDEPFITLAPDWVCEVISPRTAGLDRIRKKRLYAREGVGHLWLVDPAARSLEVARRVGEVWQDVALHEGDEVVRAEPFDALEIDLARWWA